MNSQAYPSQDKIITHSLEDSVSADTPTNHLVVVIGAGPAGIYAARQLAQAGKHVILLNRDIKPGGLAEYGIYYDKYKMKDGLRKQFRQILETAGITYYGNVTVGNDTGLSLEDLKDMGFQAILVTAGAQGTKWLGLPGEENRGVYHAKDIVYHYNKLPPYSVQPFQIGNKVALVGVGNVMMDIAHWLVRDVKVGEVIAVARRGPAEVKFSKKEMEMIARNLDLPALDAEIARCTPLMDSIGQDAMAAKDFILSGLPKALEPVSQTRFRFDFLASPTRLIGDANGQVCGLEVEETTLIPKNGDTKAKGLGTHRVLDVDTVVFCIGDKVDENFGLPVQWNEFVKNPNPSFPVDGLSYEAFDPDKNAAIEGVFVAGWSREASSGLVGVARKDGENGARAAMQYLEGKAAQANPNATIERLLETLRLRSEPFVTYEAVQRLEAAEQAEAERLGVEEYKMKTNEEMLSVLELA
jgi:ferredoxin--NADP+ reductase